MILYNGFVSSVVPFVFSELIMTLLNRINLTQDEENCIMLLLTEARQLGYLSSKEQWYPVIDSITQKYTKKKYQNIRAEAFQTL